MKKIVLASALAVGLVPVTARPAFAHHSFAAEYDASKPITLHGKLTKLSWVNPHGWIYLEVRNPDNSTTDWAVEFGGPNALLRRGLRETDFPLGIELTVNGYLAKNGKEIINGTSVKLPDGRSLVARQQFYSTREEIMNERERIPLLILLVNNVGCVRLGPAPAAGCRR